MYFLVDIFICYCDYHIINQRVITTDAMDSLDEKLKNFFKKCAATPNLKADWKDEQMAKIKQVCILSIIYLDECMIISSSTVLHIQSVWVEFNISCDTPQVYVTSFRWLSFCTDNQWNDYWQPDSQQPRKVDKNAEISRNAHEMALVKTAKHTKS